MNDTVIPSPVTPQAVLDALAGGLGDLSPQARQAASYVLENPNEIGVSSIRQLADAAGVKPNTFVRLARAFGFDGFETFREPFRQEIRRGTGGFQDRARWLQSLSEGGKLGALYGEMAQSIMANIEQAFATTDTARIKAAADAIVAAGHTYVLGVGINHTLARNFAYLADMALDNIHAIPRDGSLAIDDVARAGPGDVLLAMTFKPYRGEVIDAAVLARRQGVTVIGLSDSAASPVVAGSEHGFVVPTETPQFFTSTVAAGALLETLMAFVIADASPEVVANIERFHTRRRTLGIYRDDEIVAS